MTATLFMTSVDQTIVATALPILARDLHTQVVWAGWTITAYSLGRVVAMPVAGRLSDQFGRRTIYLTSVLLFTGSSLCCGIAPRIWLLIALRVLQSLGGSAFMPSATGMIADTFGKDRDRAIGVFATIVPLGTVVGPLLGGFFVTYWSWRGIFLINVPIGLTLVGLAIRFIPKNFAPAGATGARRSYVDLIGIFLIVAGLLMAMLCISLVGAGARPWAVYVPVFGISALACLALYGRHASTHPSPFLPLYFFVGSGFLVVNVLNFVYGIAGLGFSAILPLYATLRYGIGALSSGTLLVARGIGLLCVGSSAALLIRRTGYRSPLATGFILMAVGMAGIALPPAASFSPAFWLATFAGVTGLGMGVATPAANNAAMELAPSDVAAVSGMRGMFKESGSILAVSIATALASRSQHPGATLSHMFALFCVSLLVVCPLIWKVREHRGSW